MPEGYAYARSAAAQLVAERSALADVLSVMAQWRTLYEAAEGQPRVGVVHGRGVGVVARFGEETWVVRHYRRGGRAARLGDRYVRLGTPRSLRELTVSVAARARGIRTPEVKVAAWYDDGAVRRCDIAVTYIADSRDLAHVLFEQGTRAQVVAAAALLRDCIRKGLLHRDLNLKNVLVAGDEAYILDLDRCQLAAQLSQRQVTGMRSRLFRSLAKWERTKGRQADPESVRVLNEAFVG